MPPSRRVRGSGCTATEHVEIVKPISHPAWRGWDIALFSFCFQQLSLSVHSPPIAGQRSARSHDAMARHHERHAIHGASPRHRSRRFWITHLPCQLAVAPRLAARNLAQRLPHPQLKDCPAQIQRSLQPRAPRQVRTLAHHLQRRIHQAARAKDRAAIRPQETPRANSPPPPQPSPPARASTSPRSVAPTITRPKGEGAEHQPIRSPLPPCANLRRRHAQLRTFICPARRTKPGLVDRVCHTPILLQRSAQPASTQRPLVLQRTHAHLLLEIRCTVNGLMPVMRPSSASETARSRFASR